jgi:hypothetical protein
MYNWNCFIVAYLIEIEPNEEVKSQLEEGMLMLQ